LFASKRSGRAGRLRGGIRRSRRASIVEGRVLLDERRESVSGGKGYIWKRKKPGGVAGGGGGGGGGGGAIGKGGWRGGGGSVCGRGSFVSRENSIMKEGENLPFSRKQGGWARGWGAGGLMRTDYRGGGSLTGPQCQGREGKGEVSFQRPRPDSRGEKKRENVRRGGGGGGWGALTERNVLFLLARGRKRRSFSPQSQIPFL